METIASILFGIGVAGSTVLSVMLICMIGTHHKQKKLIAWEKQRKATRKFWNTYWSTVSKYSSPVCTAARKAYTKALTNAITEQNELNVTDEFSELEKHKVVSGGNK